MKKYISIFLALVILLTLGACAPKNTENEDTPPIVEKPIDGDENKADENNDEVVDPSPQDESREVTLYFASKDYIETGDEDLEKLVAETREVEYGQVSLEEKVVRELIKGPENTEKASTSIPTTAKLLGVELSNGTAFVNFAQEGMFGGSMQEMFTIDQIVASLIELESVDRVQFLIDGKVAESLMGHISIDQPFESTTE